MRSVVLLFSLAACDVVYSLDRPEPGQFCLQKQNAGAAFCADFDDTDGSDPLAKFDTPDEASRYAVDADAAHSKPLGARLSLVGTGSIDARMMRLLDVDYEVDASMWVRIARINNPPVDSVKLVTLHFGSFASSVYERIVYLTSEGNVIERVGTTFPRITQVDALPLDRWVHVGLAIDIETSSGRVTVDDDVTQFEFTPIAVPSLQDPVMMTIGPHDPEPFGMGIDIELLYDDVVVFGAL